MFTVLEHVIRKFTKSVKPEIDISPSVIGTINPADNRVIRVISVRCQRYRLCYYRCRIEVKIILYRRCTEYRCRFIIRPQFTEIFVVCYGPQVEIFCFNIRNKRCPIIGSIIIGIFKNASCIIRVA